MNRITTKSRNKENTKSKQFCHPERSEGSQSEILRENPQNDKIFRAFVPFVSSW